MKPKKYSKKWGHINWYRDNAKIPVEFSNPRIDEEDYNESLYGPKIMTGWIRGMYGVPKPSIFDVRSGNMSFEVDPMKDTNFKIVSYDEVELSNDLIEIQ